MKKKFKQALASLLIVVMALTGMPLGNFILPRLTANAAYEPTPESCFTYTVTNGEATITGFDKSVTDVVIPETLGGYPVTEIGEKAFSGCKNIGNVIFPEGLKTIGAYAFNGCSGLRNIDFPETLQTIGNDAFLSCSNIASLVIPDGVTDIGGEAFCYCSKLEKLVVGNGVKKIGGRAFEKTALKDITLGNSVEYLGIDSFAYCPMTGIVLPESLEVLEGGNFQGCKNLKSLTIPRNVKEIGTGLFRNCVSLEEIKVAPDNQYFTSDEYGALFTKDMREMLKYPVGNQRRSYTVPASVESVYYHYNLDDSAFYDCRNLDEIFVDENNKYLSSDEYGVLFDKEKTKLFNYPAGNPRKTYEIPDTVTTITSDSFYACSGIEEPIIPDSVTTIEKDAFFKCFSLRKVVIPDSVTSPLEYTFWDCDNLEEAYIGNGVSVIDTFAFADCGSLRFLSLGNGIKKIGFAAFFCCYNLEDVYYSGTVSDWYAVELNTLEDESSPVYYTEKFYANGELIEDLTIPDDITSLDTYHFYGYDGLKSLTIPSHVTDVAASAFYGCNNLASINILNNELNISTKAFGFLSSGKINPITTIYSHCGSTAETYAAENKVAFDHLHPYDVKETIEPSCFEDGKIIYGCDECTFHKEEAIPAIGSHNYALAETVAPSCGAEGKNVYTCSRCGDTYEEAIPALEHSYSLTETVEPTCTEDGKKVYTCANCGESYEEIIPALGDHEYALTETVAPSCGAEGKNVYTCSRCGNTYEEVIPALEHSYSLTETVEPTCTEDGKKVYTCANCGESYEEIIPALEHSYSLTDTVEPTCTEDGKKVYTCANCGDSYEEILPATGHSFGEWITEKEATIFYEGLKKRTCSVCGFEETEVIPKLTSNDVVDPDSGVHMIFPDHSFDDEIQFEANHSNNADLYERIQELGFNRVEVFDVNVYRENGDKIQPNGKVLVKVPAPEGFSGKNCSAYYIPASGKPQRIPSYYQDGYIYFETDHFSYYAIVDESSVVPYFKVTNNGFVTEPGKVINVFVSPFKQYKRVSTVLGVQTNDNVQIKSVRYELANWSVNDPEANITDNGDGTATITPNGRGIGARSVWVKITVEDVNGNTASETVKVRFYKWNWQMQ